MLKDMNSKPKKLMRRLAKLSEHLLEFPTCSFFYLKSAHVFYFILLRLELKKKKKLSCKVIGYAVKNKIPSGIENID
jgi:hypothetical protein